MLQDTVSIIITVHNGEKWVESCFHSILQQRTAVPSIQQLDQLNVEYNRQHSGLQLEVCVFDDCSSDGTAEILKHWQRNFEIQRIRMKIVVNDCVRRRGVGFGRNRAIEVATGAYLCFQDIDDEMLPTRIQKQYSLARYNKDALIGSRFVRIPANSTCRFTRWANELNVHKLNLQIYTSNGPTIVMPTWFCHRRVFERVPGGFCEAGHGTPEDLIFFYAHLDAGGRVLRVNECLLYYRYHPEATTFSIVAETIWKLRLQHLIAHVLCYEPWRSGFTIWNAGKQGRKFFRDLPESDKCKVVAFCDVDEKKIAKCYNHFDEQSRRFTHLIPIVHFREARTPLLVCMKLDLTHGEFEENLNSLQLVEGTDYILFT